jgi:hypothetical protein
MLLPAAVLCVLTLTGAAQRRSTPRFEAASVKPNTSGQIAQSSQIGKGSVVTEDALVVNRGNGRSGPNLKASTQCDPDAINTLGARTGDPALPIGKRPCTVISGFDGRGTAYITVPRSSPPSKSRLASSWKHHEARWKCS